MDRRRKRKLKLHSEDSHCCYCGRETIIYEHVDFWQPPDDEATIEHIYCKLDKRRYEQDGKIPSTKLSCRRCNNFAGSVAKKLIDIKNKKLYRYTITVREDYERELYIKLHQSICPYIKLNYTYIK